MGGCFGGTLEYRCFGVGESEWKVFLEERILERFPFGDIKQTRRAYASRGWRGFPYVYIVQFEFPSYNQT